MRLVLTLFLAVGLTVGACGKRGNPDAPVPDAPAAEQPE